MDTANKYPRWVGVVLSLFLSGAGQFFAGAKRRGVLWFLVLFLLPGLALFLLAEASLPSLAPAVIAALLWVGLWLWMLWDARRPIEKLDWITFAIVVLLGVAAFLFSASVWGKWCSELIVIRDNSMAPTLQCRDGAEGRTRLELVAAQKCAYWFKEPQRGDIVVIRAQGMQPPLKARNPIILSRLLALPGERVAVTDTRLEINGKVVREPAIFNTLRFGLSANDQLFKNSPPAFQVPAGHCLVAADNSLNPAEGGYTGLVPRDRIAGRVTRICWPPGRATALK